MQVGLFCFWSAMALDIFKPARSDKTLPLDKDAGQFRYRKTINWEVDLAALISGGEKKGGLALTDRLKHLCHGSVAWSLRPPSLRRYSHLRPDVLCAMRPRDSMVDVKGYQMMFFHFVDKPVQDCRRSRDAPVTTLGGPACGPQHIMPQWKRDLWRVRVRTEP